MPMRIERFKTAFNQLNADKPHQLEEIYESLPDAITPGGKQRR